MQRLFEPGYFNDRHNTLLPATQFRVVGDAGSAGVIAKEYWGALWGIRTEDVAIDDPPIRCIDSSGVPADGVFRVTEFLVGLLFRSTVNHGPYQDGEGSWRSILYGLQSALTRSVERGGRYHTCTSHGSEQARTTGS